MDVSSLFEDFGFGFKHQEQNLLARDLRRKRFATMVYIQSFFIGCLFIPVNYYYGGWKLSLYGFLFASISFLSLWLIKKTAYEFHSKLIFITFANIMIWGMYEHVGINSDIHFFYAPALSLPFLMFHKYEKKGLSYSLILPTILLISLYVPQTQWLTPLVSSDQNLRLYGFLSAITSIYLVAYAFYFLYQINLEHEESLIKQNELLIHSEKMSSLGTVAASIGHEINNPLTVIYGTLQILKKKNEEDSLSKKEFDSMIEKILQTTRRITKIMESLKAFSRNSKNDLSQKIIINECIEQAVILCHDKLNGIQLSIECPENSTAYLNSTELIQVLVNLLANASDANNKKSNPWIKIKVDEQENSINIRVIDCGSGIDNETQKNLFMPFFTTKNVGIGTGLGLSLSRKLLESRGALLNYELYKGNTSFVIKITKSLASP